MTEPTEEQIAAAAQVIEDFLGVRDLKHDLARRVLAAAYAATPKPDTDSSQTRLSVNQRR